jgi:hypothetical protein
MNARIRELAAQANTLVSEEHPELAKGATMGEMANAKYKIFLITEYHLEKFAELIIEEYNTTGSSE